MSSDFSLVGKDIVSYIQGLEFDLGYPTSLTHLDWPSGIGLGSVSMLLLSYRSEV